MKDKNWISLLCLFMIHGGVHRIVPNRVDNEIENLKKVNLAIGLGETDFYCIVQIVEVHLNTVPSNHVWATEQEYIEIFVDSPFFLSIFRRTSAIANERNLIELPSN